MAITADDIQAALEVERTTSQRGIGFKVASARRQSNLVVLAVEPIREGRAGGALDETLEGSRAVWFGASSGKGEVVVVDPDRGEFTLRFVQGGLPEADERVTLYPQDFITPLIELWRTAETRKRATSILKRIAKPAIAEAKQLGNAFNALRARQTEAILLPLNRVGLLHGPPGTGKTFTIGATVAYLLCRFPKSKILLTGPTNTAVDAALLAADDWLVRLGREDLQATMKRLGSRFDASKYRGRDHLLASGIYEASLEIAILELEEPPKSDIERYVVWKERLEAARAKLKTDVALVSESSRVVAITTNSLFRHYSSLVRPGGEPWHFAIADEASQITLPAALMAASLAACATFAGDPKQLAPIVQSDESFVEAILSKTAFDALTGAPSIFLNEQSRMCHGVCDVVSHTFYDGKLIVCGHASRNNDWRKERSPWFLNGREVPRVLVDDRAGASTWSKTYNGKIRYLSAQIAVAWVNELVGSYVQAEDILVLTPFRAQRALIRSMLGRDGKKEVRVSTVHRAQGSERKIVVFDPVDAGSPFLNSSTGRRLINVAASRAQAHLIIMAGPSDLKNPFIGKIASRSRDLWDKAGNYANPLRVHVGRP